MTDGSSSTRDPYERVRAFLAEANLRPDFAARALARIEAETEDLGTSFLWCPLGLLIRECGEEAEDLAAWSALLAARLEHDSAGSLLDRRARALLTGATRRAGEADVMLAEVRRIVECAA